MDSAIAHASDLVGRRITAVDADGAELRSLSLDDGTVLRFLWRVGGQPDRVGLQWERRRPVRAARCPGV